MLLEFEGVGVRFFWLRLNFWLAIQGQVMCPVTKVTPNGVPCTPNHPVSVGFCVSHQSLEEQLSLGTCLGRDRRETGSRAAIKGIIPNIIHQAGLSDGLRSACVCFGSLFVLLMGKWSLALGGNCFYTGFGEVLVKGLLFIFTFIFLYHVHTSGFWGRDTVHP